MPEPFIHSALPLNCLRRWDGAEIETYVPQREEYRLTPALLTANTFVRGSLYSPAYAAWQEGYRHRFSLLGLLEMGGNIVAMQAASRLLMPVVHSAFFAAGVTSKWPLFFLSNTLFSAVLSGGMTLYQRIRYDLPPDHGLASQWTTGTLSSLPSSLLGMGLLHRWKFGQKLLQDLLFAEPLQMGISVCVGSGLECTPLMPETEMTTWERLKIEFFEGLPFFAAGRVAHPAMGLIGKRLARRAAPSPEDGMTCRVPLKEARELAFMAGKPKDQGPQTPSPPTLGPDLIPILKGILWSPEINRRWRAANSLALIAEQHPRLGKALAGILRRRSTSENDPELRTYLEVRAEELISPKVPQVKPSPKKRAEVQVSPAKEPRPVREKTKKQRYPLRALGKRFREARESLGLTQRELAARSGVSSSTIINFEAGEIHIRLEKIFPLLTILGDKMDLAGVYELYNPAFVDLPYYDREKRVYRAILPEQTTLQEVLETPIAIVLDDAITQSRLTPAEFARQKNIPVGLLKPIMHGTVFHLSPQDTDKLAAALGEHPSTTHLRLNKEIPSFVDVITQSGMCYRRPPEEQFDYRRLQHSLLPLDVKKGGRVYRKLLHSSVRSQAEIARRYLEYDRASDTIFIDLPEGWDLKRIRSLDLDTVLRNRVAGMNLEEFWKSHGDKAHTYWYAIRERSIPSANGIEIMAKALDLPETVLVLKFWPQLARKVSIRHREAPSPMPPPIGGIGDYRMMMTASATGPRDPVPHLLQALRHDDPKVKSSALRKIEAELRGSPWERRSEAIAQMAKLSRLEKDQGVKVVYRGVLRRLRASRPPRSTGWTFVRTDRAPSEKTPGEEKVVKKPPPKVPPALHKGPGARSHELLFGFFATFLDWRRATLVEYNPFAVREGVYGGVIQYQKGKKEEGTLHAVHLPPCSDQGQRCCNHFKATLKALAAMPIGGSRPIWMILAPEPLTERFVSEAPGVAARIFKDHPNPPRSLFLVTPHAKNTVLLRYLCLFGEEIHWISS